MITVETASARILEILKPLGSEIVPLTAALGRVLAEDQLARRTQPPFAASAMDGYAVRAGDIAQVPATLRVVGAAHAGGNWAGILKPGEAVRIFTGAPVPQGADAIVLQEDAEPDGGRIIVKEGSPAGRWIRPAGLDFREGHLGLYKGRRLTARDIALAASMNLSWLPVHRRPRVAILPTGDEVVLPGDPIGPNQIVSANGFGLVALVEARGGVAAQLGIARDDVVSLKRFSSMAGGYDLLVTIGGASVGDHDLVKDVLGEEGLAIDFWRIAMRPGKPLMFGKMGATPVLGLPGNPVSSMVCALLFLLPALDVLQGLSGSLPRTQLIPTAASIAENDGRQDYLRATLHRGPDGALSVTAFPKQDSSMVSVLAAADGLIVRKPRATAADAGTEVPVIVFDGLL